MEVKTARRAWLRKALAGRWRDQSQRLTLIDFEHVKPPATLLRWMWHGLGADTHRKIYVAIGDGAEKFGGPGDVHLFRYDTANGAKSYLGSIRQILSDLGNLGPTDQWDGQEGIAKVHSDLLEHRGKLYFSTHDLHTGDDPATHRGGHLMSFDPQTGVFSDLTKRTPSGVAVENQGIITINIIRSDNCLVGWTYPGGHVVLHDLDTGATTLCRRIGEGGEHFDVARVVIVTPGGDVFAAYTGEGAPKRLFKLDRDAGVLRPTAQRFRRGFFEGLAESPRWNSIFVADTDGQLYSLDADTHKFKRLGSILPVKRTRRGERVTMLRNLTMSEDEAKLFTIPRNTRFGMGRYHLFEYDIASGTRTDLGSLGPDLGGGMPTGNGVWDERGGFYLSCFFGRDGEIYDLPGKNAGLIRIDVADRIK